MAKRVEELNLANPLCVCCGDDDWWNCKADCRFYCERCATYKLKETKWAFTDDDGDCCVACCPKKPEEELVCCGCDRPMEGEEDFGNNADVADTCCEECFNKHLAEQEDE